MNENSYVDSITMRGSNSLFCFMDQVHCTRLSVVFLILGKDKIILFID